MARSRLIVDRSDGETLVVRLAGPWLLQSERPPFSEFEDALSSSPQIRKITFDAKNLGAWDTGLLIFLTQIGESCQERGIEQDRGQLPTGVQRLLGLSEAVPEKKDAHADARTGSFLERIGARTVGSLEEATDVAAFVGEMAITVGKLVRGKARFRYSDLLLLVQQAGIEALGIVSLISFLVGLILAFVGAVQLQQFGAQIYVANLVGIAMAREMGAMMTAIVMAGRTGAAYAAQLGTMKVTQEIDALTTMGISPLEFLVLPRMIALCLMMPLLALYSDVVGIVGGAVVGTGMLGISPKVYFDQTVSAVLMSDVIGGVFKASVYGVLIAVAGCLRGMQCGSSSSAVGDAATAAVVTGIITVVSACGLFAVIFYVLGI